MAFPDMHTRIELECSSVDCHNGFSNSLLFDQKITIVSLIDFRRCFGYRYSAPNRFAYSTPLLLASKQLLSIADLPSPPKSKYKPAIQLEI